MSWLIKLRLIQGAFGYRRGFHRAMECRFKVRPHRQGYSQRKSAFPKPLFRLCYLALRFF